LAGGADPGGAQRRDRHALRRPDRGAAARRGRAAAARHRLPGSPRRVARRPWRPAMSTTITRRALLGRRAAVLPRASAAAATNPADLTVGEAAALLRARRLSSAELTDACLARIAKGNPVLNAWVRTYPDVARGQAAAADRRLAAEGSRAP